MADAAPAPKSSGWSAIEIIIVLILLIALLSRLRGVSPSIFSTPEAVPVTTTEVTKEPTASKPAQCGVMVLRPKPLEKVGSYLTLTGTTSGCGWESKDGIALYAQVIDAYGIPMSEYTSVPVSAMNGGAMTFSTTIPLVGTPAVGNGYVILFPALTDPSSQKQTTNRIPIQFKR